MIETELRRRLIAELEDVARGVGTDFFWTPEHNPHDFPAFRFALGEVAPSRRRA